MLKFILSFFTSFYWYRNFLVQSVARDLRKKYKRSVLGYFWSMLNPLLMMGILALVFSHLMKGTVEYYAAFLFCGMLPWNYFSSTAMASLHSIKGNMSIISQIPVPKYIFLLSQAASNLYTFIISLVPLFLIFFLTGKSLDWHMLYLPLVILPMLVATLSISLLFAVFNVFFDDTEHLSGVILQALYFLSPVLYDRNLLPEYLINYLKFNPMFGTVEFMRDLFYFGRLPDWTFYFETLGISFVMLFISLIIFKKADNKFIYFV